MRPGNGPGGATGLAVNDVQLRKWALSFAICGEVCASLDRTTQNEPRITFFVFHKLFF